VPAAALEPVVDRRFEHPEGVVWDARRALLLWVDLLAGTIVAWDPASGALETADAGQPVGAVAPRAAGGLVCAVRDGFALLSQDGALSVIDDRLRGRSLRMNDGAVDPQGRFWAGSMPSEEAAGRPAGALYRLDPDGSASERLSGVGISNGIGWSPDGTRCYYNDSATGRVDEFAFDAGAGALRARRTLARIDGGLPDGLAVDADGCVWVAVWGGGEVRRLTPAGAVDRVVRLPGSHVSTCSFGGADLRTLFVAVSQQGLDARERSEQRAGFVFALDPGVRGLPSHEFAG
jgi:sugar lactone lactonase YvrE